jgi:hypothetical protein
VVVKKTQTEILEILLIQMINNQLVSRTTIITSLKESQSSPEMRTEMFSRINNICQNFHVLNPEQKLYWLLNNENEKILASICNLIKQSTI